MLMRATVLYVLFVFASLAGAIAVWQAAEVRWRNDRLADAAKIEDMLRHKLQAATDAARAASRRARLAEQAVQDLTQSQSANIEEREALKANLAAARQQASVAETAMTETEDKLAAEIAAHANLKAETTAAFTHANQAAIVSTASVEAEAEAPAKLASPSVPPSRPPSVTIGRIEPPITATAAPVEAAVPSADVPSADTSSGRTAGQVNAKKSEAKKLSDGNTAKHKRLPQKLAKRPIAKKAASAPQTPDFPF
jgi:hypothetical protein